MPDDHGVTEACEHLGAQLALFADVEERNGQACAGLLTMGTLLSEHAVEAGEGWHKTFRSSPPWDGRAADALLSAHELVRRLETSMRLIVAGNPGRRRGGSDANTRAALKAISAMSSAVPAAAAREATRLLNRAATRIEALAAVDTAVIFRPLRAGPGGLPAVCPGCQLPSLRYAQASGVIMCVNPGCEGDLDGNPVRGRLDISKLDGSPVLGWADGTVATRPAPPEPEPEPEPVPAPASGHVLMDLDDARACLASQFNAEI